MRRLFSAAVVLLAAFAELPAWADKVALLPSSGGDSASADEKLGQEITAGLTALGHTLVPAADVKAAIADPALAAHTPDALAALATKLGADWVVYATGAQAITTERVEIGASYSKVSRFQLVGREVDRSASEAEIKEMLAFLLRPEGIGTDAPPWEKAPPKPPPPPPPNQEVKVEKPDEKKPPPPPPTPKDPYGGGHMGFIAAGLGGDGLVVRPDTAQGSAGALVGVIRGGVAILDTGLEPYAQVGGHLAGPASVWIEAGVRWMGLPILNAKGGVGLHLGPSVHGGVFILPGHTTTAPDGSTYVSESQTTGTIAGSVDLALRVADRVQIDAQLGEVRFAPIDQGSTVSVGGNITGGVRF